MEAQENGLVHFVKYTLKVMKREASYKHSQAVKTMQFEKKLFKSHLHSSVKKMCRETCN